MEVQSVVTELLNNFEFSIPKGAPELQHGPGGFGLIPIVPGEGEWRIADTSACYPSQ